MAEPKDSQRPASPDSSFEIPLADEVVDVKPKRQAPAPDVANEIPLLDDPDDAAPAKSASKAPGTPAAPLPRLWKAEPDEDPAEVRARERAAKKKESEPDPASASKSKSKKSKPADTSWRAAAEGSTLKTSKASKAAAPSKKPKETKGEDSEKGALIEETPLYDTYEARQRVRIIIGSLMGLFVVFGAWVVYRTLAPIATVPEPPNVPVAAVSANGPGVVPNLERDEQEAKILFDRARDFGKAGKTDVAVERLTKITTKYKTTKVAIEARQALERQKQGLPLFGPALLASSSQPAATAPAPVSGPKVVVDASQTNVSAVANAPANLVLPRNPAEPSAGAPAPSPSAVSEKPSKPLPPGFSPRRGSDVHPSGWAVEIVGERDVAPMVLVPGGTFIQGRNDADPNEGPEHKVTLGTYYIDKHEVTVRQFNLFEKETKKRFERTRALNRDPALATLDAEVDAPVVMVTASEARDYCTWAGKRLPTEAQWEAAARTPDGRFYPWGPKPPNGLKPRDLKQLRPIMSNPDDESFYGAFDLAGNAREWTKDWYDPHYYLQFRTTTADNPTGPSTRPRAQQLVIKSCAKDWVVTSREGLRFDSRANNVGFRGVLQVEGPGNAFEPPPTAAPAPTNTPGGVGGTATVPF